MERIRPYDFNSSLILIILRGKPLGSLQITMQDAAGVSLHNGACFGQSRAEHRNERYIVFWMGLQSDSTFPKEEKADCNESDH